ncbi:MAG: coproporphyrinogen III oxidase family protein [Treponema sp.]|nr:coproporphyrinogen III oxidase family protein [Treponema sp.]
MTASLYIHVPFCSGTCDYCDFYSLPVKKDDPRLEAFIDKVLSDTEARLACHGIGRVPTLYIGGGTPSVLGAKGILRLLRGLESLWPGEARPFEITVEANPESADRDFLSAAAEGGATRLSLGVQSFREPSRRLVRRTGDGGLLPERLEAAAEIFPGAFSADIISGLPLQTEKILLEDLERLLSYRPAHVSLYALTVEEGTPLAGKSRKAAGLPPPDQADRLWIRGRDFLEEAGYGQYEVSNFCLPGKESRHNIRYWRMENWLGLGPAASGTLIDDGKGRGLRRTVLPDADRWLGRETGELETGEFLDPPTLMKETILMGFRYIEGPDAALFKRRFRRDVDSLIGRTIARWRERGLMRPDKAALNKEGLLFLDPFIMEAFGELESCL